MFSLNVFNKNKGTLIMVWLTLLVGLLLNSQKLGKSDLGFRVEKIDVKLSQKFPPAIAIELLENQESPSEPSQPERYIPLRAGFPELEPIELEEVSFGTLDPNPNTQHNKLIRSDLPFESEEEIFTEEEKLRLRMAREQRGLYVEDITPAMAPTLGERAKAVISQMQTDPNIDRNVKVGGSLESADVQLPESQQSNKSLSSALKIQGEIEFVRDGSLAMTDQHFIDVRRFEEGVAKEVGQVNLADGTFSMTVNSSRGVIVGRLTNQRGGVEGEGVIAVSDLLLAKGSRLVLKRTAQRQPIRAGSAYGKKEAKENVVRLAGLWDAQSEKELTYDVNSFDTASDMIVEADSKNHRPTLSIVNLKSSTELVLLPDRMIWGLKDILSEQEMPFDLDRGDGLIWGTIVSNGRPVDGATVLPSGGPVSYLGGFYLPDRSLRQTSENGMFVVVSQQTGWQSLYVSGPDGAGVHINVLVAPGKVSMVKAELPIQTTTVTLRSFDAFAGVPVRAQVELQQLNEIIEVGENGAVVVELPKTEGLSFVRVNPEQNYERIHFSYGHLIDYLHAPLIPRHWFADLKASVKLNDELQSGHLVGFVQGDDFLVEIPNKTTRSKTVYFDPSGQVVERGVKGGGFVILNLEETLSNLVIVSQRTHKELSRIVKPERESIQVLQASFE